MKNASTKLDILLHTAEFSMDSMLSNIRSLDTKASIILALFGVLLIPSLEILHWAFIYNICILLKYAPLFLIVLGIYFNIRSLLPRNYLGVPDVDTLIGDNNLKNVKSLDDLINILINCYIFNIGKNRDLVKKKIKNIEISIFLFVSAFSIILLFYLFKPLIDT